MRLRLSGNVTKRTVVELHSVLYSGPFDILASRGYALSQFQCHGESCTFSGSIACTLNSIRYHPRLK